MAASKGKKKAKFAKRLFSEVEIQDSYSDTLAGAIQVHIATLQLREDDTEMKTRGVLSISYGNQLIGQVEDIPLRAGILRLDYTCALEISEPDHTLIDALIATPFFFSLSVRAEGGDSTTSLRKKSRAGLKKTRSQTSSLESTVSANRAASIREPARTLGQGNMDLLPLLLEGGKCEKTIVLERPGYEDTLFFARSCSENPCIQVTLADPDRLLTELPLNNIMWLSVESIFNPSEPYFMDDAEYTAVFPIPLAEQLLDDQVSLEPAHSEQDKIQGDGRTELDNSKPWRKETPPENHDILSRKQLSDSSAVPGSTLESSSLLGDTFRQGLEESILKMERIRAGIANDSSRNSQSRAINSQRKLNVINSSDEPIRSSSEDSTPCEKTTSPKLQEHRSSRASSKDTEELVSDESSDNGDLVFDATRPTKASGGSRKSNKLGTRGPSRMDELKSSVRALEISRRMSDFSLVELPQGTWTEEPQLDLRKTWASLASISGGPSKHHHQIEPNSRGLLSKFEVDIQKKMEAEAEPRIAWNMVRPYWLTENEQENMIKKIYRYGVWPLEVMVDGGSLRMERENSEEAKRGDSGKEKMKRKTRAQSPSRTRAMPRSYIAWLDLSTLLYPGRKSVRVAGQLQLFDKEEGECLWGLESTVGARPAEALNLNTDSASEPETRKPQSKKTLLRKDSTARKSLSPSGQGPALDFTESKRIFMHLNMDEIEENISSKAKRVEENSSSGELQLDSSRKLDSKNTRLSLLEKENADLTSKYDKLKSSFPGSRGHALSECSSRSSEESEVSSVMKDNCKKMKDIVVSELEEQQLHKALLAKDALDMWAALEHKNILMERHALASLKKKIKEELILSEPEKFYNEEDEPVFIVVDIKFLKPLVPKNSLRKIEADVAELIPPRAGEPVEKKARYNTNHFQASLAQVTSLIYQEYMDFSTFCERADDERGFYDHLVRSRAHQKMTELLREGLVSYVQDAIGSPLTEADVMGPESKDYIGWLYCRLMDEIHAVVNTFLIDRDRSTPLFYQDDSPNISKEEYLIFATEAAEERDTTRLKTYVAKMLSGEGVGDAQQWSNYAVLCLRLGDYPKAVECLREALALDIRHKESLLMYGVLLTMGGVFDAAELFFSALVEFYPEFAEGWITFHTFYLLVEKAVGADAALIQGTKCRRSEGENVFKPPQLAWDNSWYHDSKSYYLNTAIYLLSFNLYEMGEVCLAQELERTGEKSEMFTYYLAVCHYIQGRYQDSSIHLSRALAGGLAIKPDPRLWIILGHNKWELGKKKEAVRLYMEAFSSEEPPENAHMAYIRGGYYFLEVEKAELAQQMFLRAVKTIGTPMGWLGLGIALYMLEKMVEAELALKEANTLDNTLPVTWAYLGLICLHRNKIEQFQQCIHEANRHGLNDEKLKKMMEEKMKLACN